MSRDDVQPGVSDRVSLSRGDAKIRRNDMSTIVIIVLVLLFLGVLPTWPHSANWGYYPTGGVGLILLVLVVLLLTGRL
jgi:Protein of unknown function (DUF3309)